jgi:hypothetical protein
MVHRLSLSLALDKLYRGGKKDASQITPLP